DRVAYPEGDFVHELIAARGFAAPDRAAVVAPGSILSYGELLRRADRLAGRLQGLGVGPERLVGIFVERSPEMVVGLLATLRAGGAYLPLDPSYPSDRLAFMLEDAAASVLLTERRLAGAVPLGAERIVLIDDPEAPAAPRTAPPLAP